MKRRITAIRDIDEDVLRKFKAKAVERRMKMGDALTVAMKKWIREREKERVSVKALLKMKPFDWGRGTEKTSLEVDEILYGKRK